MPRPSASPALRVLRTLRTGSRMTLRRHKDFLALAALCRKSPATADYSPSGHSALPWLAAIAFIPMVVAPYSMLGFRRATHAFMGTLAGAWLAVICAVYINDSFIVLCCMVFVIMFICFYLVDMGYFVYGMILTAAICIMIITSLAQTTQILQVALWRTCELTVSISVGTIVSVCLLPIDPVKKFDTKFYRFLKIFVEHYAQILSYASIDSQHHNDLLTARQDLISYYTDCSNEPFFGKSALEEMGKKLRLVQSLLGLYLAMIQTLKYSSQACWFEYYAQSLKKTQQAIYQLISFWINNQYLNMEHLHLIQNELVLFEEDVVISSRANRNNALTTTDYRELFSWLSYHRCLLTALCMEVSVIRKIEPSFWQSIKPLIQWQADSLMLKHCFKISLAVTIALILWQFLSFPGGSQGLITAIVISSTFYKNATWVKMLKRIAGIALGCGLGLSLGYALYLNEYVLLFLLAIITGILCYFMHKYENLYDTSFQGLVGFYLMLATGMTPTSVIPGVQRFFGMMLGLLVSLAVHYTIWPLHPKEPLNRVIVKLRQQLLSVLQCLSSESGKGAGAKLEGLMAQLQKSQSLYFASSLHERRDRQLKASADFYILITRCLLVHLNFIIKQLDLEKAYQLAQSLEFDIHAFSHSILILMQEVLSSQSLLSTELAQTVEVQSQAAFEELRIKVIQHNIPRSFSRHLADYYSQMYLIILQCQRQTLLVE